MTHLISHIARALPQRIVFVCITAATLAGCVLEKAGFETPELAAESFVGLACKGDVERISAILKQSSAAYASTPGEIVGQLASSCSLGAPQVHFEKLKENLEMRKSGLVALKYPDGQTKRHEFAFNKLDGGWVVDGASLRFNVPSEYDLAANNIPLFAVQLAEAVDLYTQLEGTPPRTAEDLLRKVYLVAIPETPGGASWIIDSEKRKLSVVLPADLCNRLNEEATAGMPASGGSCESGAFVIGY